MNIPDSITKNLVFVDTFQKLDSVMEQHVGKNIRVAYSGGADSDIVMHLLKLRGYDITGVFYDTGLEYAATWEHLDYMRSLGFNIEVIKARRPIPTSQRNYGYAFISKRVADMLERLQKHNFDFQQHGSLPFDVLYEMYPKCKSALRWWTNTHNSDRNNIKWNRYLKEFLIEYGLPFKVSGKCCDGAKKLPIKEYTKAHNIDLMILGIRRAEGGARASTYKGCFVPKRAYTYSMYFPLFFWKDEDRLLFEQVFDIRHSAAYHTYGLKRTGCAGCPFGLKFEEELDVMQHHEPKLLKGVSNIFGPAYGWTRKYKAFVQEQKQQDK